ncbi:MAG: glycosyltransferase family 39 protein, partial [candidate division NC10 bacterium]|nr:glycosyltransferase family 39 protein [candidate division NC10 bacterium]
RHAERAREMMASRQWMTPTYLGQPDFDKPPVHYWLMAGAGRLFGAVDTVFCLPSAVFGLIAVLLTFALGASLYGPRAGGMAGFVLATAFLFVYDARMAFIDLPLVACITAAIFAGRRALELERGWGRPALVAAFMLAAGAMMKGLVGLVLPPLVLGLGGIAARRWRRLAGLVGLAIVITAPLYISLGSEFTGRFLAVDHLRRFFVPHPALGGNHPWYFYGPALLGDFLPWTILLPAVGVALACTPDALRRWRLPLVWFGGTFLLLSLGANKREPYLLPLFPAVALLFGVVADEVLAGRARRPLLVCWRLCLGTLGGSLGVTALVLPLVWPTRLGALEWGAGLLMLAWLGGWVAFRAWHQDHRIETAVMACLLILGATQVLAWQILPAMNLSRSARQAAASMRTEAIAAPIAVVEGVDPALVFYLDLPQSTTARLSATRIRRALLAGWRVLVRTTELSPVLLSREGIAVRARVRLQQSEYLVLERLDRRSSS